MQQATQPGKPDEGQAISVRCRWVAACSPNLGGAEALRGLEGSCMLVPAQTKQGNNDSTFFRGKNARGRMWGHWEYSCVDITWAPHP